MYNTAKQKLGIFIGDTFGALSSAIVALPQLLAFGVVTGLGAGAGIWGAIILCTITAILGPKIPFISGITGPITIVIASIMHALNGDISSVILILVMAGILQTVLAMTSFPEIVKYVPYPVISGFMNGIGIIIILMQLPPIFGFPTQSNTIESLHFLITNITNINHEAFVLAAITLAIIFLFPKKWNKYIPTQIIALIAGTLISMKAGLAVTKITELSLALPQIRIPHANLHDIITYAHYAVTLAIVLCVESLLSALVANSLLKTKTSGKKLLLGLGIGNIVCSLTGSLPGAAATMRTVAAINSGATTRLAVLINPLILTVMLFKFSNFVTEIPMPVLAAILIKIGFDIIDIKLLKVIKFAPKDDLYVLFLVFFLTVFYNLIIAVGAGITFAALLYAKRIADTTKVVERNLLDEKVEKQIERDYNHKIRIVHIEGQFFFGSATQIISQFDEMLGTKYLILDYTSGNKLDISAIFALEDIIVRLKAQNIRPIIVLPDQELYEQLNRHGITSQIGENHIFYDVNQAINFAKKCLKKKKRRFTL